MSAATMRGLGHEERGPTDQPGWGTYTVNPDCSGTKTLWLQGLPFPIENRFVIVDKGDEIRIVVMSPLPIIVTAQGRRVF